MFFGFNIVYRNPHPDTLLFINFFLNVGKGVPAVTSGPLSATFPTLWLKPLATQLVCNLIFLNNFLLCYTKNAYNQRDVADVA